MMAYIQLTLLGIPAKVIQGDTLTLKFQQVLYTPFYFLNGVYAKLKQTKEKDVKQIQVLKENMQLKLFV